jgi:lysozyme family protein
MADFDPAVEFVLGNEDGLEENPDDNGGITNHGISLRFLKSIPDERLKAMGFPVSEHIDADFIRKLTIPQAKLVYKSEFWNTAPFSQIPYQKIANVIFDAAVNMGMAQAIKCVQRAICATQANEKAVPVDGVLGANTIRYITLSGFSLLPAIRSERAGAYRLICSTYKNQAKFLDGWLKRSYNS